VRLRLGTTFALALLVGGTLVGSSAGAHPNPPGPVRAAGPELPARHVSKLPWEAGPARVVPHQVVVVWRASATAAAEHTLSARLGTTRIAPTPELGVDVVRVPAGRSVDSAMRALRRSPLVRSVEPNRIATVSTNDTHFGEQWALDNTGQTHTMTDQGLPGTTTTGTNDADVDAPEAWAALTQHNQVVVAVIDTGVDVGHQDLVNSMWVNPGETPGNGIDDDGNGFKDDINGWDFTGTGDANPTPTNNLENSHGTHVAGIVAAEQGNSEGIAGVCPDCRIMALRIGSATSLTLGAELKAINYAINNGADVINMSFGSDVWSKSERNAINKAGKHGILVVIAAGNASADNDIQFYDSDGSHSTVASAPSYPATYTLKNILTVAATNDRDNYAYFSQCRGFIALWKCGFTSWGHDSVDVAAPGVDILSTVKRGQGSAFPDYEYFDGTSMAAPLVAGIAGLVLSEHSGYTPIQVKNAIMRSVDHPTSLKLYDSWADVVKVGKAALSGKFTRTHGRVNALAALSASTTNATPVTDGNIDGARSIKGKRTGSVSWPADANDVFKKRLVKGSKYHVVLNGPTGRDFDLWVWKPGTKEIFQFTPGCFKSGGACPAFEAVSAGKTADEAVTFKAPKTGVFYIQVNGWYSGGNYTLTIKKV
jgi:subtilisin family serine protease